MIVRMPSNRNLTPMTRNSSRSSIYYIERLSPACGMEPGSPNCAYSHLLRASTMSQGRGLRVQGARP